jgi:hypothetical protein
MAERMGEAEWQRSVRFRERERQLEADKLRDRLEAAERPPSKPIRCPKRDHFKVELWDSDGCLIQTNLNESSEVQPSGQIAFKMAIDLVSREIIEKTKPKSLVERQLLKRKEQPRKRSASVSNVNSKSFEDFLERQAKSCNHRTEIIREGNEKPRHKSVMSEGSRKLVKSPIIIKKRKVFQPDQECTFRPQLSLTSSFPAKGISWIYPEARNIIKEMKIAGIALELKAEELKRGTCVPASSRHLDSYTFGQDSREKWKAKKLVDRNDRNSLSEGEETHEKAEKKLVDSVLVRTEKLREILAKIRRSSDRQLEKC